MAITKIEKKKKAAKEELQNRHEKIKYLKPKIQQRHDLKEQYKKNQIKKQRKTDLEYINKVFDTNYVYDELERE